MVNGVAGDVGREVVSGVMVVGDPGWKVVGGVADSGGIVDVSGRVGCRFVWLSAEVSALAKAATGTVAPEEEREFFADDVVVGDVGMEVEFFAVILMTCCWMCCCRNI